MLRTIANAFSVADIRKKLAFTAAMLLLYRLGAFIPSPGVDLDAVREVQNNFGGSNILGFLNLPAEQGREELSQPGRIVGVQHHAVQADARARCR